MSASSNGVGTILIPVSFGHLALHFDRIRPQKIVIRPEPVAIFEGSSVIPRQCVVLLDELMDYLGSVAPCFQSIPDHRGTPFQERVWAALRAIPPGEVRTYGAIASAIGSGARAVAGACRANPFPLVTPCHRVVGAADLGGYCGSQDEPYLSIKRSLLVLEGWQGF